MKPYYQAVAALLGHRSGTLLEIGAGEADFLVYAVKNPCWQARGCDIHEHAGLDGGRAARVRKKLAQAGVAPEAYVWIGAGDPLPAGDGSVNMVVSLQTLEHVADLNHLFVEIHRVLAPGGLALHYFPAREIIIDPHSGIPLAHRASARRRQLLATFSRLHVGKFPSYAKERGQTLGAFVDEFDRYLAELCHFRRLDDYLAMSREHGLLAELIPPPPLPRSALVARLAARFTSVYLRQDKPAG